MPRNISGVYTLPAGNPVIPGTLIESTWANPTLEDVAAALTGSLPRDGSAPMEGPLFLARNAIENMEPITKQQFDATMGGNNSWMPAGAIQYFATEGIPAGWLLADGRAVSRASYSDLFGVIGTLYGSGNGLTTFNLPDMRGTFIRTLDNGRGIDVGRVVGSQQSASNAPHVHTVNDPQHNHVVNNPAHTHTINDPGHIHSLDRNEGGAGGSGGDSGNAPFSATRITNSSTTGVTVAAATTNVTASSSASGVTMNPEGTEARPVNIALIACIRAFGAVMSDGNGQLGTMSEQNADAVNITGGSGVFNHLEVTTAPVHDNDVVRLIDLPPSTGAPVWGSIIGTLANQLDLQGALDDKQDELIVTQSTLLGRHDGAGSGDPQEVTLGAGLSMTAGVLESTGGGVPEAPNDGIQYGRQSLGWTPVVSTGGSTAWGSITGTLSNQTDLQTALNAKYDKAGGQITGSVEIVGSARRIRGAFDGSGATLADRTIFQSSQTNSHTTLSSMPSGTGTGSYLNLFAKFDLNNSGYAAFGVDAADVVMDASRTGSAAFPKLKFRAGGIDGVTVIPSGMVGINNVNPVSPLDVDGDVRISGNARRIIGMFGGALAFRTLIQTGIANDATTVGIAPTGTGTGSYIVLHGKSDTANSTYCYVGVDATTFTIGATKVGTATDVSVTLSTVGGSAVLSTAGNFGIGTDVPATKLDVAGAITASFDGDALIVDNPTGQYTSIRIKHAGVSAAAIYWDHGGNGALSLEPVIATGSVSLVTAGGRLTLGANGSVLASGQAGMGYGPGAGGTVTQADIGGAGKGSAVTLNKPCGRVTTIDAALAAGASVIFATNNNTITVTDGVVVNALFTGSANPTLYRVEPASVYAGGFEVRITNLTAGSLSDALDISFEVFKGATS